MGVYVRRRRPGSGGFEEHPDVKDGQWHYVAAVYDGAKFVFMCDGTLDA